MPHSHIVGPGGYPPISASGGLNAAAVEAMQEVGGPTGRVVWLPTRHADRIRLFDVSGAPTTDFLQVLDVVAARDLVLATGHTNPAATIKVIEVANTIGIKRILVTHALSVSVGATLGELQEMVDRGALIELVYLELINNPHKLAVYVRTIKQVGAAHIVLSCDLGQVGNPSPISGLQKLFDLLREAGIPDAETRMMVSENPAKLIDL